MAKSKFIDRGVQYLTVIPPAPPAPPKKPVAKTTAQVEQDRRNREINPKKS